MQSSSLALLLLCLGGCLARSQFQNCVGSSCNQNNGGGGFGGFGGFGGIEEEDEVNIKDDWFLNKEDHQTLAGGY